MSDPTRGRENSPTPVQICAVAVRALDVTGAGISVMTPSGHRGTVCSTDDVAAAIEELQFSLGEGPCVEAFQHGPVLIADLDDPQHIEHSPWPQFTKGAASAGARALFALPLQLGAIRVGVLDLYRNRPGLLDDERLALALTIADAAAVSLLADRYSKTEGLPPDLTPPGSAYHASVHQASGIISVHLGITIDEAFVRLRARAFATGRSVNDVGRDIVTGALAFTDEGGGQQ